MNPCTRKCYTCDFCQKTFTSKCRLSFHIKNIHNQDKNLKTVCDVCNQRFSSVENYKRHFKTRHVGVKDKRCDSCSSSFAYKSDLKAHKLQHHCAEVDKIKCTKCAKGFGYKSSLKRIISTCGKKDKDITCNICGKTCVSKNYLYQHNKAKHCPEVYICEACAKCFDRKDSLKRHTLNVHKDDC